MPLSKLVRSSFCAAILAILVLLLANSPAHAGDDQPKFLSDTNFFGKDIRDFDLPEENPRLCYDACVAEKSCHAFTYLRPHGWPGAGPTPHCWIKTGVSSDVRHEPCCVSGVVGIEYTPAPQPTPIPRTHIPTDPTPPGPKPPRRELDYIIAKEVKLTATPAVYEGSCPVRITYHAEITATERGKVSYAFVHGDKTGDSRELSFYSPGTKDVTFTLMAGAPSKNEDFREKVQIINPTHIWCVHAPCPQWAPGASADAVTTLRCTHGPEAAKSDDGQSGKQTP